MSEMVCCPLSGGNDNPASFQCQRVVTARKPHKCNECREVIPVGIKYENARGCWDGDFSVFKTCLSCVEIRDHFNCGEGFTYGQVWIQLEESFFPDMVAGGPCMAGLSPEAKGRLFERRMKWYAEQHS